MFLFWYFKNNGSRIKLYPNGFSRKKLNRFSKSSGRSPGYVHENIVYDVYVGTFEKKSPYVPRGKRHDCPWSLRRSVIATWVRTWTGPGISAKNEKKKPHTWAKDDLSGPFSYLTFSASNLDGLTSAIVETQIIKNATGSRPPRPQSVVLAGDWNAVRYRPYRRAA